MSNIVLVVGFLVFLAHMLTQLFRKTFIPDVLILVLIGMMAGPVFGWVTPEAFGKAGPVLSTLALIVILFESGTSLEIKTMQSALGVTFKLALGSFAATALIVTGVGHFFLGLSWIAGAMWGAILGGTSSAVVIPMVAELGLSRKPSTVLVLESALTDVISIIGLFAIIRIAMEGGVAPGKVIGSVLAALIFAMLIGVLGGIGWLLVLRRVRDFPNTISSTLAYVFVVFGITETLGFSGAIAAMAFGITLTNYKTLGIDHLKMLEKANITPLTDVDMQFYREAVFLLKTFFFIFLGISIRFSELQILHIATGMLLAVFAVRILITRTVADADFTSRDTAISSMMAPKGLAAAVLAAVPMQYEIQGGEAIRDATYMAVLISITLCALLVAIYPIPAIKNTYTRLLSKNSKHNI